MKAILMSLFVVGMMSCAHHGKKCSDGSCEMRKDKKEECGESCKLKKEKSCCKKPQA